MAYGKELILDIHDCDINLFNRRDIRTYFIRVCNLIDMQRCDLHFWDEIDLPENEKQTSSQTSGVSAVQFILTSNITIHTLDLLGKVFINIFSCKDFNHDEATSFSKHYFVGRIIRKTVIERK